MKRSTTLLTLWLVCVGCDQLIGIHETEVAGAAAGGDAPVPPLTSYGGVSGSNSDNGAALAPTTSTTSGGALSVSGGAAAASPNAPEAGATSVSGQNARSFGSAGSAAGAPAQVFGGRSSGDDSSGGAAGAATAAEAGGSTRAGAPSSPPALTGVALWLDANSGIDFKQTDAGKWVTEWRDRSPNHNDARQPDLGKAPRFSARGANGEPGVTFDGDAQCLRIDDSASLNLGTRDFILEVVGHFTNSVVVSNAQWGYGMFACKPTGPYPYTGPCLFTNDPPGGGATVSDPGLAAQLSVEVWLETGNANLNDGIVRSYALVRSHGDQLSLRVNGVESAAVTILADMDASSPDSPLWIGGTGVPAQALRGLIAELILIDGYSAENLAQLESYVNAKYDLWPR